jgi:hypothetical protein
VKFLSERSFGENFYCEDPLKFLTRVLLNIKKNRLIFFVPGPTGEFPAALKP